MKKLLLSLLIMGSGIIAGDTSSANAPAQMPDLFFAIRDQLLLSAASQEEIRTTLTAWHTQNPSAFTTAFSILTKDYTFTMETETAEGKAIYKEYMLAQHLGAHINLTAIDTVVILHNALKGAVVNAAQDICNHCEQVCAVLQDLGLKPTLSPYQLTILGRYLSIEMFNTLPRDIAIQQKIILLQELAKVSNIELPEELKS